MERTCNKCVFPRDEREKESEGICPTDSSLVYAAGTGKLSCVKELVAAGADVNATCECHGSGALMSAAMRGHIHCLKELLISGAEVNIQSKGGHTTVMLPVNSECLIKGVDFCRSRCEHQGQ